MTNATLTKFATESDQFYMDCTKVLAEDDAITGTVSMSYLPADLTGGDALSFSAASINTVALTFPDGRAARVGSVIMVRIAGGTAVDASKERTYTVVATFTTANGNTKAVRGRLLLLPLGY